MAFGRRPGALYLKLQRNSSGLLRAELHRCKFLASGIREGPVTKALPDHLHDEIAFSDLVHLTGFT